MQESDLKDLAVRALEDLKANDIKCLDVRRQTEIADYMIVVSGTSNRHVKSLVNSVVTAAREAGVKPLGVEGLEDGEWVLIDLADVLVHVMLPETREFYDIERLWSLTPKSREENSGKIES